MSYHIESFIEGMMEKGKSGTLKELVAMSKLEKEAQRDIENAIETHKLIMSAFK